MKHWLFTRWCSNPVLGALFLVVMVFSPIAAQSPTTAQTIKNKLRQNGTDQEDVRNHTAALMSKVQVLIDELAANGISGDDAKVLRATKNALANLSGPEMNRVIASLQQAGAATNPADARANAANVYTAQKGIILQFRMILKEYEVRLTADELLVRFKKLTEQQTETMRTTEDVARAASGRTITELSTMEQTTQQIVQTDQDAIVNEVDLAREQLDKAVEGNFGDDAKPLLKAQDDMKTGHLQLILSQATDDLKAGLLMKALSEQLTARNELRRITQDLNPPSNAVVALAQTAADLAKLIDEQKRLLDQTSAAINTKTLVAGLNDQQGTLVDEAYLVQQDIKSLSEVASGLVKDAIDPMQTSRSQLQFLERLPTASTAQRAAIVKLEEAQKQLEKELADATKAQTDADIAKTGEPAADPAPLTTAAGKLEEAQTNVGHALTDANPPAGSPQEGVPPSPPSMTEAVKALTAAIKNVGEVANTPGLPDETKAAVTEAETDISQGKIDAANGDAPGTATQAGAAQIALTRAQASLAMAMAGMPGTAGMPGSPMSPGPSQNSPNSATMVTVGSNMPGRLHEGPGGVDKFIGVQPRVRIALSQSEREKRPMEYASLIDQYLRNLADQSSASMP